MFDEELYDHYNDGIPGLYRKHDEYCIIGANFKGFTDCTVNTLICIILVH